MTSIPVPARIVSPRPAAAQRGWLSRHWFLLFASVYGLWVWLPFLAPVFMHLGWETPGRVLYFVYSFFCHQLPERSFFFFGPQLMLPLSTIGAAGANTANMLSLRQFVGTPALGWKVAWSDRMVSFYTSIWLFAVLWHIFRRKARALRWWVLVLLVLPLMLDGTSHLVSDLAGIGQGFRDSNAWLAALTAHAFPASFYAGDALGSFNSLMRLVTGVLAGFGLAWFAFPYMEASFAEDQG
jgi:uncharacterized membrane protein